MSETAPQSVVIAIDGPAASGKSSVSRELAARHGFVHVNSGAMYRALAWSVVRNGVDPEDAASVIAHLARLEFACGVEAGVATLTVDGVDPGAELKSAAVNATVSLVAKIPEVREVLVAKQRECRALGDIVMEGRDIGSVVFPGTPYKFYIDASPEVRAARRREEGITDDLAQRDATDSQREASPLVAAEGAVVIDTSEMPLDEVVAAVEACLRERGLELGG